MRFLFTTLQTYESEFYARVGEELRAHGHEVAHVTVSRHRRRSSARRASTPAAWATWPPPASPTDLAAEVRRIEATYDLPHIRDVYRADWACSGRSEEWCVARTVRTLPRARARLRRRAPRRARPRGRQRDDPRRRAPDRRCSAGSRCSSSSTRSFRTRCACTSTRCTRRSRGRGRDPRADRRGAGRGGGVPPLVHRRRRSRSASTVASRSSARRAKVLAGHVRRKRDERPRQRLPPPLAAAASRTPPSGCARGRRGRSTTGSSPARPFVYFPLHVTDDYKITRIIPHCVDQVSLVEQVADALPRRLRPRAQGAPDVDRPQQHRRCCAGCGARPNVRLVQPVHELARPDPRLGRRSR